VANTAFTVQPYGVLMQLAHSFSAIKLYENCPKRYYHQRVTKEIQDKGGEASKYGERIHEALEARLKGANLTPETEKYEALCFAIDKLAENPEAELFIEHQMTLTENLTGTSWFAKDAWLRSILDVLVVRGDQAIVMDWKTGKRRPDFTQLEMFALQVFKHFPDVNEVTSTFVWLKDMKMDAEVYKRSDADKMWEELLKRINRIYQSAEHDNWPAKPSGLCRFCPAQNMCDYAQI